MPLLTYPKQILARFRAGGVRHALAYVRHTLSEKYHEYRLGVQTAGFVRVEEPVTDAQRDKGGAYEPITYASLMGALRTLSIDPQVDGFIDVGCGKGRALVIAAMFPFKSVYGVELSAALADVARRNLQVAAEKLVCHHTQVTVADAREYVFPDEVSVVLLYFSFAPETLALVLQNLRSSRAKHPRRVVVIFKFPVWAQDPFVSCTDMRMVCEMMHFSDTEERLRIYHLG